MSIMSTGRKSKLLPYADTHSRSLFHVILTVISDQQSFSRKMASIAFFSLSLSTRPLVQYIHDRILLTSGDADVIMIIPRM
jgi:hypothetical protein